MPFLMSPGGPWAAFRGRGARVGAANPKNPRSALAEAYAAHAADVPDALANLRDDPANEGEAPFNEKTEAPRSAPAGMGEWWE